MSNREIDCDKEKNSDYSVERCSLDEQKNNIQLNSNIITENQTFSQH